MQQVCALNINGGNISVSLGAPTNPTSFCDVLITRVKCAAPGKRRDGQEGEKSRGWGRRRRRSSSSASPILMCFFDRPWNYAWWFLKCFNWSGPKLKLNSILGGRQYVCFFCLFCSVLKMQKWATQLKFQKHSLYLKNLFFSCPSKVLCLLQDGKDSRRSPKRRRQIDEMNKFLCCLDYFASCVFSSKLNERVFMVLPVIERFVDTIQNETELK